MGTITKELFQSVPEIEFNIGYQYFLGNISNYNKALMSILKSVKSKLPLLQMMCLTNEYEGLRTITQTLRKMLTTVGATFLSDRTYELEMTLLNESKEEIYELLTSYMKELGMFSDNLELLLKKLDANKSAIQAEEQATVRRYDYSKSLDRMLRLSEAERNII